MRLNSHTYLPNSLICVSTNLVSQTAGSSPLRFMFLKKLGEKSMAKNYCPVSLLSLVSKVFEKLVSNRFVDHFEKCDLLSNFHYAFRFSRSIIALLAVKSYKIARVCNRSRATQSVALDISKAFTRV